MQSITAIMNFWQGGDRMASDTSKYSEKQGVEFVSPNITTVYCTYVMHKSYNQTKGNFDARKL